MCRIDPTARIRNSVHHHPALMKKNSSVSFHPGAMLTSLGEMPEKEQKL